jgi:hypothetical protein
MKLKTVISTALALSFVAIGCGKSSVATAPKKKVVKNKIEEKPVVDLNSPAAAVDAAKAIIAERATLSQKLKDAEKQHNAHTKKVAKATRDVENLRAIVVPDAEVSEMEQKAQDAEAAVVAHQEVVKRAENLRDGRIKAFESLMSHAGPEKADDFKQQIADAKDIPVGAQNEQAQLDQAAKNARGAYLTKIKANEKTDAKLKAAIANLETLQKSNPVDLAAVKADVEQKLEAQKDTELELISIYELDAEQIASMTPESLDGIEIRQN